MDHSRCCSWMRFRQVSLPLLAKALCSHCLLLWHCKPLACCSCRLSAVGWLSCNDGSAAAWQWRPAARVQCELLGLRSPCRSLTRLQLTACRKAHHLRQPAVRRCFMAQRTLLCPCYACRLPAVPWARLHSTACCAADCLQQPALVLT